MPWRLLLLAMLIISFNILCVVTKIEGDDEHGQKEAMMVYRHGHRYTTNRGSWSRSDYRCCKIKEVRNDVETEDEIAEYTKEKEVSKDVETEDEIAEYTKEKEVRKDVKTKDEIAEYTKEKKVRNDAETEDEIAKYTKEKEVRKDFEIEEKITDKQQKKDVET